MSTTSASASAPTFFTEAKEYVLRHYGKSLLHVNPEKFYALTMLMQERFQNGASREIFHYISPMDLTMGFVKLRSLIENSYSDYSWTEFLRRADEAMWDAALADWRAKTV